MMDGAIGLGANLPNFAFSSPSVMMASEVYLHVLNSSRFACSVDSALSWRISTYFFAGDDLAALRLSAVGGADLHQFRLRGELLLYVCLQLYGVGGWIGALCGIRATDKYFRLARCR